ncbi:4.1 G protein, putative [Schistosoma mansoni]|uniref:4.1 G protein, putative n=1 Tax=Schistosoma mansoni TaxID=6183 RepID=UPI00022C8221|nr:4.1 G protein, putative [Schistosoma mansoni]|eukprot:XP_018647167.1 4.1 G protein, putative [Schistosoma mansoni]
MKLSGRNKTKESSKKRRTDDPENRDSEKVPHSNTITDDSIHCKVRLLDDTQTPIEFTIKKADSGSVLFKKVCQSIGDLVEYDYFGLRYTDKDNIRQWLELDKSVYKQLKDCKSFVVNFRVKHYPPDPVNDLAQSISRYLVYLQIRRDLTQGRLLCPPSIVGELGALVAQAEIGDAPSEHVETPNSDVNHCTPPLYDSRLDSVESTESTNMSNNNDCDQCIQGETLNYTACCEMLRKLKIIFNQTPEVEAQIMKEYQKLRGLKAVDAETELLRRASQLPTYGIDPVPATTKYILHSFRCKSKTAAFAFWHWVVDRKCFFTGRSQQELRACTGSIANLPQQSFSRVSSFRRVIGLYPNSDSGGAFSRSTLPGRLRPSNDYFGNRSEKSKTLDEVSPLMSAFSDIPINTNIERIPDTVVEQPCEEDLLNSTKASPTINDKKLNSNADGDEKDLVIQAAVESWIEPTQIVQQTVSAEKINIQPVALEKCSPNMVVRKRTENGTLTSTDYTQAVIALDKTLDHHSSLSQPDELTKSKIQTYIHVSNGEAVRIRDDFKVCANGPTNKKFNYQLITSNGETSPVSVHSYTLKENCHQQNQQQKEYTHNNEHRSSIQTYAITLTATAFVVLVGVIALLETTPTTSNHYDQNVFYQTVRHNFLVDNFQEYVYTPLKMSIVNGFSFLMSYINP